MDVAARYPVDAVDAELDVVLPDLVAVLLSDPCYLIVLVVAGLGTIVDEEGTRVWSRGRRTCGYWRREEARILQNVFQL